MSKIGENLEEKLNNEIEKLGYDLEYVECEKEGNTQYVRIVIDSKCGITTEDCEKVSKSLEDKVDKLVKYESGYILEVASPGLERKLKNIRLYNKYIGSRIQVKLYEKIDNKKEIEGTLVDVIEDIIVLDIDDKKINIDLKNIACGNTVFNFEGEK